MKSRTIKVDYLARVEGEGSLHIKLKGGAVEDVRLEIFEPPRFFEALLRGRDFTEAPDITARICGICPIAYLLGASRAMEDACGVEVAGSLDLLRRLIYCGEWIESHALHLFMLHAPDFLGYQDAVRMARDHPELVQRGLRLKKVGNDIMALLGGREIHPINLRVGGFFKVPEKSALKTLQEDLRWGLEAARETVRWAAALPFPEFEQEYEFVALRDEEEYAIVHGRLTSNQGIDCPVSGYDDHLVEEQVAHSTALQTVVAGRSGCALGPLARFNLNFDTLSPLAQEAAREAGLGATCRNPFQSIIVRGVEILYACEEALRLIDAYERPDAPAVPVEPRAGTGYGCTEAPRGICYHRYTLDESGAITDAKIVAPTAVNQKTIERDLRRFVSDRVDLPDEELRWQCEQAVRNYDPCISCSAHFLDLQVDRS
ncbi:MAG: Ni/Fe hydrogenase subunit alpha [Acidobacteria bacterium]|nr:Ni/Fe hydrogenase subunit alpha [Acidobacteriota bacterium]